MVFYVYSVAKENSRSKRLRIVVGIMFTVQYINRENRLS